MLTDHNARSMRDQSIHFGKVKDITEMKTNTIQFFKSSLKKAQSRGLQQKPALVNQTL